MLLTVKFLNSQAQIPTATHAIPLTEVQAPVNKEAEAYLHLGNLYFDSGELEHAIRTYSKAIGLDPDYLDAYKSRGNAYYKSDNLELAIQDYSKAIELEPNFAGTYFIRGAAYSDYG